MRTAFLPLLLVLAGPALAQAQAPSQVAARPPSDPISNILIHGAPGDEDEPDTQAAPRTAPEPEPSLLPGAPAPQALPNAPRPQLKAPVRIEEAGKTPDSPPQVRDLAYDARIRASFASAQSFQGPLDGGWTLADRNGDRYVLQIVDRRDRLEAVWRDLRRAGAINASGLVDSIQRADGGVTLKFTEAETPDLTLTLRQGADGRWAGKLARGDATFDVTLRRTNP
ncbi:hypothetical protein [Phenylobacterium sp.]|uniref:hypothetical protein n=1 Tax=Phenylobacterium sp. TaxID=1871053 RepID=UPI00374D6A94